MKTLHGEGYLPPRPWDTPWSDSGLHYRDIVPDEAELLEDTRDGSLTFDAYQQWVEAGWKTPFRSQESADRLLVKLQEELEEFIEAYEDCRKKPSDATREHLAEETGDIMWVLTAITSNSGAVASTATGFALPVESKARLQPRIVDIAEVIPEPSTVLPELDLETEQPLVKFTMEALDYGVKGQHQQGVAAEPIHQWVLLGAVNARRYPQLLAQLASITADTGVTLNDAISNNIQKLSHRRTTNTIDKTDQGRA